ncbi:hypothetical protein E2C01_028480 [Portunus trituberculatus]|uniref:Uncharacterized protein n=1 Tax=Portunus trituberculatus TaxID=210409 RepID=A0A5B7EPK6_PORTR|nr:hypothetical protein [Portunus trituberculatus]
MDMWKNGLVAESSSVEEGEREVEPVGGEPLETTPELATVVELQEGWPGVQDPRNQAEGRKSI